MTSFWPISTYFLYPILNNNDSLTIGITFAIIGESND